LTSIAPGSNTGYEYDYAIGRQGQFPKHCISLPSWKHQDLIITRDFGGSFIIAQRDKGAVGWRPNRTFAQA
jgi:hypothetical protein